MARQRQILQGYHRSRAAEMFNTPPVIETEADWLSCTDPYRMFVFLCPQWGRLHGDRAGDWVTDRRLRLYVEAAGCYQCQELTRGQRAEMAASYVTVTNCGTRAEKSDLFREIFGNPWNRIGACGRVWLNCSGQPMPHKDCRDCARLLSWNDGIIPRLAQRAYESRDFSTVAILADALEEAGALPDSEIVRHFRGQVRCAPHPTADLADYQGEWVTFGKFRGPKGPIPCKRCKGTGWVPKPVSCCRGCWAMDLLLGKER